MKIKSIKKISLDTPKQYYDVINANPYNNFLIKTNTGYIGSHNCFFDEVSFQPNQDIEKQRLKAKNLVNTASARQQSRFMKGNKNPTLLVLASSKRTEQSYMETFIESKKKQESKTTLIIDEPQWVIRTDKDSDIKFNVAVGNKFLNSEVIPLNATEEEIQVYRDKGYKILKVPIGYYESFLDDIDIALTDIAGISTTNATRYISGQRLSEVITKDFKNAFIKDVIEVGNAKEDTTEYKDFFDLSRIDPDLKLKPWFIHWDMSLTGDKTGLAGVCIVGKKPTTDNEPPSKDLFFKVPFVVSIKAPKGYQVSFEKNRNFVRWLRNQGFNIKGVSSDTYQSADLQQQLKAENFNCSIISVDRVVDKVCQPYQNLRSAIYEKRIAIPEDVLLQEEFLGLQRDSNGKIDHDPSGINCFTGDTKIRMLDGTDKTILELLKDYKDNKTNYVYTFNHELEIIEPKKIKKVFKSGSNAKLVEVKLDNDIIIKCTPEHKFMTRLGEYIQAKDLKVNDSLMPLYTKYPNKGELLNYRLYYEPIQDKWHYEHRSFAKDVFDTKYLVHHKDCNPKNNRPDNLIWMSKSAHMLEHARLQTGAQSVEAKAKKSESIKLSHKNVNNTKNGILRYYKGSLKERQLKKENHDLKLIQKESFYTELSNLFNINFKLLDSESKRRCLGIYANYKAGHKVEFNLNTLSSKELKKIEKQNQLAACRYYKIDINSLTRYELHGLIIKYYNDTIPGYKEHIASEVSKNHFLGKYLKAKEALSNRIWWTNGKLGKENNLYLKIDEKAPDNFWRGRTLKNHKVKSVTFVDYRDDVYDIEVEDNHNFALSAGVFVHNSKDSSDAVTGALWNASQNAEQFAFDYGETLDLLIEASSGASSPEEQKKQITIAFEKEIQELLTKSKPNNNLNKEENPAKLKEEKNFIPKPTKVDFGLDKAKPITNPNITNGILFW